MLRHPEISKIIICIDSECSDENEIGQKATDVEKRLEQMGLVTAPKYVVVVHALEGWLLADPGAIQTYLGSRTNINVSSSDPIDCKPKKALSGIFRKAGKDFDYIRDDPGIAGLCDPACMSKNNKSFEYLKRVIEDP
jgi:hypothetical protein